MNRRIFFGLLAALGLPRVATAAPLSLPVGIRPDAPHKGVSVVYIDTPHGYVNVTGDSDIPLMVWLMEHKGTADLSIALRGDK